MNVGLLSESDFPLNGTFTYIEIDTHYQKVYYDYSVDGEKSYIYKEYNFYSGEHSDRVFNPSPPLKIQEINDIFKEKNLKVEVYLEEKDEYHYHGLQENDGEKITDAIYSYFIYEEKLNALLMHKKVEYGDGEFDFSRIIDAIFFEESGYHVIENMHHLNSRQLEQKGYTNVTRYVKDFETNFNGNWTLLLKNGVISANGEIKMPVVHDYIGRINYENNHTDVVEGFYLVEDIIVNDECSVDIKNDDGNYTSDCLSEKKIYNAKKDEFMEVAPGEVLKFNHISPFSLDGYAFVAIDNDNPQEIKQPVGLIHFEKGVIVKPTYHGVGDDWRFYDSPKFDSDGFMKVHNLDVKNGYKKSVGLANSEKIIYEAIYEDIYYKDKKFHLKIDNLTWRIEEENGKNIDFKIPEMYGHKSFDYIELLPDAPGDKVLIRTFLDEDDHGKNYEYGILNNNEVFLEVEYSNIEYVDNYWKLEKYDGSYQTAIMREDGSFIVPFDSGYDSVSDFIGGYSVGKKIAREPAIPAMHNHSKFSLLKSLRVYANEKNIIEILDDQGNVVGDVSDKFEEVILAREVDGIVKAFVKMNGAYYRASLVVNEVPDTGGEETPVIPDKPIVPGPTIPDAGDSQGPDAILPEEDKPVEHSFKDVPENHEFYEYIMYLAENDIITGYTIGPKAGSFGINENLSRRHAAVFLFRAMNLEKGPKFEGIFNDVKESESGAYEIEAIYRAGIITGYTNDDGSRSFKPKDNLTRAQFAKMTVEAYQLEQDVNKELTFTDLLAINEKDPNWWANDYIKALVDNNIVDGYKVDNTFRPNGLMTRGHLSKFLYNAEKTK